MPARGGYLGRDLHSVVEYPQRCRGGGGADLFGDPHGPGGEPFAEQFHQRDPSLWTSVRSSSPSPVTVVPWSARPAQ
ncbi:hypothetical protein ADK57_14160 [Streptomyces sp. MMG1533]|nr:hypothetical protein ADK57_14160 [Streptomyces sp. MMG1533]